MLRNEVRSLNVEISLLLGRVKSAEGGKYNVPTREAYFYSKLGFNITFGINFMNFVLFFVRSLFNN